MKISKSPKNNSSQKLAVIAQEIEQCQLCKVGKSGKAVPGEGSSQAAVMFIGEAPGKTEAATGRPFVGRSGKYLRSLITGIGLKEEDVYITSPVKYLPDRGTPTPSDIAHGMIHLNQQFSVIDPKIIVLLGSVATQGVLGEKIPVMQKHGTVIEKDGGKYFLTIHPAAAIRFAKFRSVIQGDFEKLKKLLDKSTV